MDDRFMEKLFFLCGKKSLKKPAVELPHEIIESEILPRLSAMLELPLKIIDESEILTRLLAMLELPHDIIESNAQHLTNSQSLTHHKLLDYKDLLSLKSIDCEDNRSVAPLSVPHLNGALKGSPIASLDGLVFVELPDTSEFAFWNPLTGAYKKFLLNSPRSYTLLDAFYFDSSNNDYKVLQVTSHGGLNAYTYFQRFNTWTKIQFLENPQYLSKSKSRCSKPTFLSHSIYFMVGKFDTVLIVFDVKSEKFREIGLPMLNRSYAPSKSLVVLKGCIRFSFLWSCFDRLELSLSIVKNVHLLGYSNGFQVLDVDDGYNFSELTTQEETEGHEGFKLSHPLLLVVASEETRLSGPSSHSERDES
ncbi:ATG18-like protein [Artemisia annua]|uniref:ATG18-like protein n=1 Tax=Artemisia annua TaxID=35608 RepID=A0A2U1PX84_ARTAN|nr:ATG18-like protein [Artemisia annua]